MNSIAYAAFDVHVDRCVLGMMHEDGTYLGAETVPTRERALTAAAEELGRGCEVTLEEGPVSHWVASVISAHVKQVVICDPKENFLISRGSRKDDRTDVHQLCRLLRLGELNRIYHPEDDHRLIFKSTVQHYLDLTNRVRQMKQSIKSRFRRFGVLEGLGGQAVFTAGNRPSYLDQLGALAQRQQLEHLYALLDACCEQRQLALRTMKQAGSRYPEIAEFRKIPGVGPVVSHVFDAFVMTAHRFGTRQQLWRYSKLGITSRSSDGKPLGYERLDRAGNSELKQASYTAFLAAQHAADNEVKRYYRCRLERNHDHTHARLTTQRKLLTTMWTIWRKEVPYDPTMF